MANAHDRTFLASLGFADPDKKEPLHDRACQFLGQPSVVEALVQQFGPSLPVDEEICRARLLTWSESVRDSIKPCKARPGWFDVPVTQDAYKTTYSFSVVDPPRFEVPLVKGEGQYMTTIGYLDAVVAVQLIRRDEGFRTPSTITCKGQTGYYNYNWSDLKPRLEIPNEVHTCPSGPAVPYKTDVQMSFWYVVEAKIKPISLGDILRQMNTYRTYERFLARTFKDPGITFLSGGQYDQRIRWVVASAFQLAEIDAKSLTSEGIHYVKLGTKFDEYVRVQSSTPNISAFEL